MVNHIGSFIHDFTAECGCDQNGDNTLMIVARAQPTAVAPILAAINQLSSVKQTSIFTQTSTDEGYTAN